MEGDFIDRHHVEPRVQLYVPKEESFTIPLKYIDVTRTTHANLDMLQEKPIDDYWIVEVDRNLSHSWRGCTKFKEIEKASLFDHEDIKDSTRTERPVSRSESTQSCVLMPTKIEEEDQTRTVRPVKVVELDIDFKVPGLSHAVVKEAEHFRVQSRACEKDRKSSSSRSTSSRIAAD